MVSPDDPVLPPTQMTIGCVLLGVCVALLFYGILLCQGYGYFRTYADDPAHLKLTVAAILMANAVNVGLAMHTCYDYLVLNYRKQDLFTHVPISFTLTPISVLLCIAPCQYVHSRRTFLILPQRCRWVFVALEALLYTSALVFILVLTVQVNEPEPFERWLKYKWLVSAAFGCPVVCDLGLACVLGLVLHVNRTGLKRTDAILNSIIVHSFRSAIITSMLSISCLVVAVSEGHNLFILPLSLAVAKIYANVTLVTLNLRRDMWERLQKPLGSDFLFGSLNVFRRTPRRLPVGSRGTTWQPEGPGETRSAACELTVNNEVRRSEPV